MNPGHCGVAAMAEYASAIDSLASIISLTIINEYEDRSCDCRARTPLRPARGFRSRAVASRGEPWLYTEASAPRLDSAFRRRAAPARPHSCATHRTLCDRTPQPARRNTVAGAGCG